MKALVCEMCNSNNLIKSDGFFVCQNCGIKYSVEEAKKMMIEVNGPVDVSGSTIKVDNTSFVQKSLENARRAKSKEDWEECEKYYNMVEQHDPKNIEAIFYSAYGKAKMAMVESDRFKREQKLNVLKNSISVIDDNYDPSPEKFDEQRILIEQIDVDLMNLFKSSFVYNKTTNGTEVYNDSSYTYAMFIKLCEGWIESLKNISKIINNNSESLYVWKLIRKNYEYLYYHVYIYESKKHAEYIGQIDAYISYYDQNYHPIPLTPRDNGGCYVATCVYGSYDCPQVWTLRRYRDYQLAKTWYGRAFIRVYYAISPTIVKLFGNTKWFKKMWKRKLDHMVKDLQESGYESTPYEDRKW